MNKQQEIVKRNEYIKSLQQFIHSSNEFLQGSLKKLDWTKDKTIFKDGEKRFGNCPLDSSHRIPVDNIEKHMKICSWHKEEYSNDSLPLPSPTINSAGSIIIDKELQRNIILQATNKNPAIKIGKNVNDREVPQTSDRLFSDFTTDERRVLYDYVVSKTAGKLPQLKEFSLSTKPENKNTSMTKEQLMAAERDAKRRRVRYRKVHTKSKKYSEVLREVINNQMLAYEDWVREHLGEDLPSEINPLDKKNITEETTGENKEMIWLDWDYRGNPHLRWKYILEKEKRRLEKRDDKKEEHRYRRKEKDESTHSRSSHYKSESQKDSNMNPHKRKHSDYNFEEVKNKDKTNDERREQRKYSYDESHSRKDNSHWKKRSYSSHSRWKEDRYSNERYDSNKYGESKYEDNYKDYRKKRIKEEGFDKESDLFGNDRHTDVFYHDKKEKGITNSKEIKKHGLYDSKEIDLRIKEESSPTYCNSGKSYGNLSYKKSDDKTATNDSDSNLSSSSTLTQKSNRNKKPKKKHKHKKSHKKKEKHRQSHYSEDSST